MAAPLRDRRAGREARDRQGTRWVPRGARLHRPPGGIVNPRVERLRASLEELLLVTNPTNVFYLTGFKSSNPALLVESDRLRLFSDFRYAEAARSVDGVEFVETKRALLHDLAGRLSGRIAFESAFMTYAGYETLRDGGRLDLVPRAGLVEELRAVKDEQELRA